MVKQDKKWWKEYWKIQKEMTKEYVKQIEEYDEKKKNEAMTHFEPVPTVDNPNYFVWKEGQ